MSRTTLPRTRRLLVLRTMVPLQAERRVKHLEQEHEASLSVERRQAREALRVAVADAKAQHDREAAAALAALSAENSVALARAIEEKDAERAEALAEAAAAAEASKAGAVRDAAAAAAAKIEEKTRGATEAERRLARQSEEHALEIARLQEEASLAAVAAAGRESEAAEAARRQQAAADEAKHGRAVRELEEDFAKRREVLVEGARVGLDEAVAEARAAAEGEARRRIKEAEERGREGAGREAKEAAARKEREMNKALKVVNRRILYLSDYIYPWCCFVFSSLGLPRMLLDACYQRIQPSWLFFVDLSLGHSRAVIRCVPCVGRICWRLQGVLRSRGHALFLCVFVP